MAVNLPISTWIEQGKTTQYLYASKNANYKIFKGKSLYPNYWTLLWVVRSLVEFAFTRNPDDPTLYVTGPFLQTLLNEQGSSGSSCIPPTIVSQPITQEVDEGDDVTIFVVASGTSLTYQWYKDAVELTGETGSSLEIENFEAADEGSYNCVVTNECGSAVSNDADLTMAVVALQGDYYYGDDSYVANLQSGIDDVPYVGTFPITDGQPLEVTLPLAAEPNKWHVYRYPESQSVKTTWFNTITNNGGIPDAQFWDVETFGGKRYIFSRTAISIDASASPNMTFDV